MSKRNQFLMEKNAHFQALDTLLKTAAENAGEAAYKQLSEHYPADCLEWAKEAKWTLKKAVTLADIDMARRPGGRNMKKVENIAKELRAGKTMPPVFLVKRSDGKYSVADGYHRTLGYQKADKGTISAYVAEGCGDEGPWDKEMHEKKLNVELGKTAAFESLYTTKK